MIPMIALALLTQPPEILQFGPEDIGALPAAMTQVEARARRLIIDLPVTVSIVGRLGQLDELEKALQAHYPNSKLRKSETKVAPSASGLSQIGPDGLS